MHTKIYAFITFVFLLSFGSPTSAHAEEGLTDVAARTVKR